MAHGTEGGFMAPTAKSGDVAAAAPKMTCPNTSHRMWCGNTAAASIVLMIGNAGRICDSAA